MNLAKYKWIAALLACVPVSYWLAPMVAKAAFNVDMTMTESLVTFGVLGCGLLVASGALRRRTSTPTEQPKSGGKGAPGGKATGGSKRKDVAAPSGGGGSKRKETPEPTGPEINKTDEAGKSKVSYIVATGEGGVTTVTVTTVGLSGREFKGPGGVRAKLENVPGVKWAHPDNDPAKQTRTLAGTIKADGQAAALAALKRLLGEPAASK